ncbi:DoxX family protein [Spirosoma jeollabukense]
MNLITTLGRLLYATALIILGAEHLINANFPVGLLPVPMALPGRLVLVYLTGGILLIAGAGLLLHQKMRLAALVVSGLFGLFVLAVHLPLLVAAPTNGGEWTALFECLALSGGALPMVSWGRGAAPINVGNLTRYGRWLFASSLAVFGVLHFVYASYIATLIPGWIPVPLFWSYFVGVAFIGTTASIFLDRQRPLATAGLGLMFLLWVLLLHGPRVVTNPHSEPEWTSLCVALAMSGSAFVLSGSPVISRQTYLTLPRP